MAQLGRLYVNKVIAEGRYFVRIVELNTEPGARRPLIEVVVETSTVHGGLGGVKLYCPIHPTLDADPVYEGFLKTFDLEADELDKAVGRYARVAVKHCEHNGTKYSGVRFVPQRDADYADAPLARKADKEKAAQAEKNAAEKVKKKTEKAAPMQTADLLG